MSGKSKTKNSSQNEKCFDDIICEKNLSQYPPINFRKAHKCGFRIGAHVDIGIKDFETGMTFGKNNIREIQFSENNNHLKLLKSLENESESNSKEKDKIINTLMSKLPGKDTTQTP